jgi:hypothetical protein
MSTTQPQPLCPTFSMEKRTGVATASKSTRTVPETVTYFAVPDQFSEKDKQMLQAIYSLFMSVEAHAPSEQVKFVSFKNLQPSTLEDLEKNHIPLVGTC